MKKIVIALAAAALAVLPVSALAQSASAPAATAVSTVQAMAQAPAADKSGYTLFDPTPDSELRDFCTDRPTKFTYACTVDAGHVQLEGDFVNGSYQNFGHGSLDTYEAANLNLKVGLTNNADIEFGFSPADTIVVNHRTALTGISDLTVKLKYNVLGDDGGPVSIAIEPITKLPTGRPGIGNGAIEEGIIVPINVALPKNWTLTLDPEVDALKNSNGWGYHENRSAIVNLAHPITQTVSLTVEYWTDDNRDPLATIRQRSFDFGFWWTPKSHPTLELDAGLDLGLTRATPSTEFQVGFGHRF